MHFFDNFLLFALIVPQLFGTHSSSSKHGRGSFRVHEGEKFRSHEASQDALYAGRDPWRVIGELDWLRDFFSLPDKWKFKKYVSQQVENYV